MRNVPRRLLRPMCKLKMRTENRSRVKNPQIELTSCYVRTFVPENDF